MLCPKSMIMLLPEPRKHRSIFMRPNQPYIFCCLDTFTPRNEFKPKMLSLSIMVINNGVIMAVLLYYTIYGPNRLSLCTGWATNFHGWYYAITRSSPLQAHGLTQGQSNCLLTTFAKQTVPSNWQQHVLTKMLCASTRWWVPIKLGCSHIGFSRLNCWFMFWDSLERSTRHAHAVVLIDLGYYYNVVCGIDGGF